MKLLILFEQTNKIAYIQFKKKKIKFNHSFKKFFILLISLFYKFHEPSVYGNSLTKTVLIWLHGLKIYFSPITWIGHLKSRKRTLVVFGISLSYVYIVTNTIELKIKKNSTSHMSMRNRDNNIVNFNCQMSMWRLICAIETILKKKQKIFIKSGSHLKCINAEIVY